MCERLYSALRQLLPGPDLFIKLSAPKSTLLMRRAKRKRDLDIAEAEDLDEMELLLQDWLPKVTVPVISGKNISVIAVSVKASERINFM